MKKKIIRWAEALIYVGFIYATLGVARSFTDPLRNLGVLNLTIESGYILIFGACLLLMIRRKILDVWRYVVFIGVLTAYYFTSKGVVAPEEKIHFFEYGLVGILFFRALELHFQNRNGLFTLAFLVGSLAGLIDELIQKTLPNRVYDIRDVGLNAFSVALGLILLACFPARTAVARPEASPSSDDSATIH